MKAILIILFSLGIQLLFAQKPEVKKSFKHAERQTALLIKETEKADKGAKDELVVPRTLEDGKLKLSNSAWWTSGFFPGTIWYLYEYNKKPVWLQEAKKYTTMLEKEQFNTGTHDLGFMMYCSFGNGYRLTGDTAYRSIIIQSAKSLSKRFSPSTGVIRSWDHNRDKWEYPVIIDNMMNLELLFEATKMSGDSSFYKIAVTHANNTLKNHFRTDFSSYHVVDYDVKTGTMRKQQTHQGYSDASAWARGQAWALYGYVLCYRETKDERYLKQAEGIAHYILTHPKMPADLVPYWDYDDPAIPNTPRDASAASITASALYELSHYSNQSKTYITAADKMLHSLYNEYRFKDGEGGGFILNHSTGNKPKNSEIDAPLTYADYYYLEALLRSREVKRR